MCVLAEVGSGESSIVVVRNNYDLQNFTLSNKGKIILA
jgi:hypothetical protein